MYEKIILKNNIENLNKLILFFFFSSFFFLTSCATTKGNYHHEENSENSRNYHHEENSENSIGIELGKKGEVNFTTPNGRDLELRPISPSSPIPAEILKGGITNVVQTLFIQSPGSCWTIICRNGSCGWALINDIYCPPHTH